MTELDPNRQCFEKWKAVTGKTDGYVAFIDGDPVEHGADYNNVAIIASELKSQRGKDARLAIFEVPTGASVDDSQPEI